MTERIIHMCIYVCIYLYTYTYSCIHITTNKHIERAMNATAVQVFDASRRCVRGVETEPGGSHTPSPPAKSFDFRVFDSSRLLILRGGNSHVR